MTTLPTGSSQLLEPQPNQPFSIESDDAVWMVQAGKLDLFLVREHEGRAVGARHHFLRVEQGAAVFGMKGDEHGIAIVATATPETQLLLLSRQALRQRLHSIAGLVREDYRALLEGWIAQLGLAAAAGTSMPGTFTNLEAGATLEIGDDAKPILPLRGIVWVDHLRGASQFLNSSAIDPIAGRKYFPVSRNGWLQPVSGSQILTVGSEEWERSDPDWTGLQTFHDIALRQLLLNREITEEKNRSRLRVQAASDAAIVRSALRSLASPLQEHASEFSAGDGTGDDPLLLVCQAVGKQLGVTITAVSLPTAARGMTKDVIGAIARASELRHRIVVLKGK
jgi:hypothetical protein